MVGQSVTLSVELLSSSISPTALASGTVTFFEGSTVLGAVPLTVNGGGGIPVSYRGNFYTSSLSVGTHVITAVYSGDTFYAPSTAAAVTVTITVLPPVLLTTLVISGPTTPVIAGQYVGVRAFLTPSAGNAPALPSGTVEFFDGTASLGVRPLNVAGGGGIPYQFYADFTSTSLTVGSHTITAVYSGDNFYAPSTAAAVTVTITPAPQTPGQSFSGPTATSSGNAQITFTGGGPLCGFTRAAFVPLVGGVASPPTGTAPARVAFKHGLIDFVTSGCTPGSMLTFVVTTPSPLPSTTQYWKYGPTASNTAPHWYAIPATTNGNAITFTITDGGLGDDDLLANGTVVDQGGPGILVKVSENDLSGDGKSDLLVQSATGTTTGWMMNGTAISGAANLITSDPNWTITHTADFNGDGKADILWRHTDGRIALWLMNGTGLISGAGLLEANSGWTVTHVADFNGDGKADILFRHADGRVAMWLMNGAGLISGSGLLEANSGWTVTHVADFNGDGKADILFRHTDGRVAMWLMNGTALTSGAGLLNAASGWTVTHTADFNGDGKADILFRHTDGRVAMWLMNGTALTSGGGLLEANSGWTVTHVAEFNGDGKADILYRHTDGRAAMWLMNGTILTSGAGLLEAASGWSVIRTGDYNGDGNADILFKHTDGRIAMWLMNGSTLLSGAGLTAAGTLKVVP